MNLELAKADRRSLWIKLGSAALIIRFLFAFFPELCELLYSRGIYPWIRFFMDHSFAYLPFPGVYLVLLAALIWLIFFIKRNLKSKFNFKGVIYSGLAFISFIVFWFLLLWGYNYSRVPLKQQIALEVPDSIGYDVVWAEAQFIKNKCKEIRDQIPGADTNAIDVSFYPENLQDTMRVLLESVLEEYGYDVSAHVKARYLKPEGILMRFNSSGVYFPFTGEANIDAAVHPVVKPFTTAHELAHGYGFGSEASCNFLGFLACIRSDNKAIQYAGYLTYWRYVYGSLMEYLTEEEYMTERATIDRGIHNDIAAIYTVLDNHLPYLPFLQPAVYDLFLKIQGVRDGIQSYDRMLIMVACWRKTADLFFEK